MDKISFTGFKNVKIVRDARDRIVPCIFNDGVESNCKAKYIGVTINCDLFNSPAENSDHLQQFYDIMQRTKKFFINAEQPQHIEMSIEKFKVLNNVGQIINTSRFCRINGNYVNLDEKTDRIFLPFYTFMARLLKDINTTCHMPETGHHSLTQANKILHNKAVHFIDNVI